MDWNNSTYIERLRDWRSFRDEIITLPFREAVERVAEEWGKVPIHTGKKVRIYEPETWDTPWEILNKNLMCEDTIALMIYHTLSAVYLEDVCVHATMRIAHYNSVEYLVVDVSKAYETYTLNYISGTAIKSGSDTEINFIHTFGEALPHLRNK